VAQRSAGMSQSILKTTGGRAGSPAEKSVRLGGEAPPAAGTGAGTGTGTNGVTTAALSRTGTERGAPADGAAAAQLSGTMSGATVDLAGRDLKDEAARLLAYADAVQQQMDQFGHGHPQGGKIAVSFAQACTALGKECLSQDLLRTANRLLGHAMHFLRQNHSMLVFAEHQRVLAEAHNNMGCLENKRGNLEPALKHILAAVEIESELEWEIGHAATLLNACSTLSLLDRHSEALAAAKQAVDMLVAGEKHWDKLAAGAWAGAGTAGRWSPAIIVCAHSCARR